METPKVFISYSHDSEIHKNWILQLANMLQSNGVDVKLDQWDLRLGDDLAHFMENSVSNSDRVLVICTDKYINKADVGLGGVGYEKRIVTSELLQDSNTNKFIPIVRQASSLQKVPKCLGSRLYIDFSDDLQYKERFYQLLREIHNAPSIIKPDLGKNPYLKGQIANKLTSNPDILNSFNETLGNYIKNPTISNVERFMNIVIFIYNEFENIHHTYINKFSNVAIYLQSSDSNLGQAIEQLRIDYLFSESQRSKIREFIYSNEILTLNKIYLYNTKQYGAPYFFKFFHEIYYYITAFYPDETRRQGFFNFAMDHLESLFNESESIDNNIRFKARKIILDHVESMIKSYSRINYYYLKISDKTNLEENLNNYIKYRANKKQ